MRAILNDFNDRIEEISIFYELLDDFINKGGKIVFENGRIKPINVSLTSTLKSNAILLLYNLIESTITNILKRIHEIISDNDLKFSELNDNIQDIVLNYYYMILSKNENISDSNKLIELKVMLNIFNHQNAVKLYFEDYIKYKNNGTFSGNLDSKNIRKIINAYGLNIEKQSKELKKIRDLRNKLAHGESSFSETCNNFGIEYMNVLKDKTIDFLMEIIREVEIFITDEKYKASLQQNV